MRVVVSIVVLGLVISCGDDGSTVASGAGTSSTGQASTSSDPATTDASASGSNLPDTGSSTSDGGSTTEAFDPAICVDYQDAMGLDGRDVVVSNTTDEPLVVTAAELCVEDYLIMEPVGMATPGIRPNPDGCDQTCSQAFEGTCGCGLSCETSPPVLIAPGASLVIPWDGAIYDVQAPPDGCFPEPDFISCIGECSVLAHAEGTYSVAVRWGALGDLSDPSCECEPGPEGTCELVTTSCLEDAPFTVQTTFDHPARDPIDLPL